MILVVVVVVVFIQLITNTVSSSACTQVARTVRYFAVRLSFLTFFLGNVACCPYFSRSLTLFARSHFPFALPLSTAAE